MAALSLAFLLGPGDAAPDANPGAVFLRAADVNDRETMKSVLDRRSRGFLKKIDGCYLRRVYTNNATNQVIAAWMCAEGPTRSRVVLAEIALSRQNKVVVLLQGETTDDRPAPEREGSAFAD